VWETMVVTIIAKCLSAWQPSLMGGGQVSGTSAAQLVIVLSGDWEAHISHFCSRSCSVLSGMVCKHKLGYSDL
jgi:hypothetical protein